jgi:hypothetical protein
MTSMGNGFDAMMGAAKGAANAASSVAKGAADAAKGAADVAVDGVTKLPVAGAVGSHAPSPATALLTARSRPRHCAAPAVSAPAPASIS